MLDNRPTADPCCRATAGIAGLNPAEDMDVGLLCLLCVVQVALSATSRSLVLRSPTLLCVSVCDLENSTMKWPRPKMGCCATGKIGLYSIQPF